MINLTEEQKEIISTDKNVIVKAFAGAGKTTLLFYYIKSRKQGKRILYLAFNKSVQENAVRKFTNLSHVHLVIRTAHSLAYEAIVKPNKYKVDFLKIEDITKFCETEDYVLISHIQKFMTYYCSCAESGLDDVDYIGSLNNDKSIDFATEFISDIRNHAATLFSCMKKGQIPMTHDYYLKLYQLSKPILNYDYILFDEGQDASEVMLDIFKRQKGIKVIVGDSYQQIYAWRNAVNSLEKFDYPKYTLSQSFRFTQKIADLAKECINWKNDLLDEDVSKFNIIGSGKGVKDIKTNAVICRTNMSLIRYAINILIKSKTVKSIYFEGGFQNYSIHNIYLFVNDILALKENQPKKVKNKKLKHLDNYQELLSFIEETEDIMLEQAVQMVTEYGRNLASFVEQIKQAETTNITEADIILTTVHKAKGCEYDSISIMDDFSDKTKLKKFIEAIKKKDPDHLDSALKVVNEEINILYVAVTRTKGSLKIASNLELAQIYNLLMQKDHENEPKVKSLVKEDDKRPKKYKEEIKNGTWD